MHAPDLTMVEELDTQIILQQAPATPTRIDIDDSATLRSPGAASEMSGTTAISSFSMIEAEFLEPKFMMKHMRKLCEAADEFLDHIVPDSGNIQDDHRNIQEIQKPDSDFTEEYRDFDVELYVHLKHFKGEEHNYIHTRAVHRALLGLNNDAAASQTGMDLVFYLTNVLVFAKQMIHSDRNAKDVWDALRQLDNSFPANFMHSLTPEAQPTSAGESALLRDTFDLALELRTQLAILWLQRASQDSPFNPEDTLAEVFVHMSSSQDAGVSGVRGWNMSALGGEDAVLPQEFQDRVIEQMNAMRGFFSQESDSESSDSVDLEALSSNFPWEATILRLLHWARLRHGELRQTIEGIGGPKEILNMVKSEMEKPRPSVEDTTAAPAPRRSPRKKRTSFGRDRRRSSRKFDPNAPVDLRAIDALKARENEPGVLFEMVAQDVEATEPATEQIQKPEATSNNQQDEWQPTLGEEMEQPDATLVGEPTLIGEPEEGEELVPSEPPTKPANTVKVLKAVSSPEKENRNFSYFKRQENAQQVEFGNGFDESQPTPGPSNPSKGKGRAGAAPSKKRARDDDDDGSDDDAFEQDVRTAPDQHVHERRIKAPVAKKMRFEPASSGAPPSHQPSRPTVSQVEQQEREDSPSEKDSPDMTEDVPNEIRSPVGERESPANDMDQAPPSSSYQVLKQKVIEENALKRRSREQQPRRYWTAAAEDAFMTYMEKYPQQYSTILQVDMGSEGKLLQEWSQVNLKDKARNMAVTMIK